jgi:hypothetical protein
MKPYKIKQIIQAQPGWVARFKGSDEKEETIYESSVAVWAIIIDEAGQRITGFSEADGQGFLTPDDEIRNFDGWGLSKKYLTVF